MSLRSMVIVADAYFDGERSHSRGPYAIRIMEGRIQRIDPPAHAPSDAPHLPRIRVPFVMPGLVEAHAHMFLDGGELDVQTRKAHLAAPFEQMMRIARRNLRDSLSCGITLIRDAGDIHGVNAALKAESAAASTVVPQLRSPGRALRKTGRYGSFMAVEIADAAGIESAVERLALTADDLKVLLTGIIDFERGRMMGGAQFDLEETRLIVGVARRLGKPTFAHCSGLEGLRIAVEAGIDSIEHGFFMDRSILRAMADRSIAWVPTFSPVHLQYSRPELAGWPAPTVQRLGEILDHHFHHLALACEMGVDVVAGSDAGSYGVRHGRGLIDELFFLRRAGMAVEKVLASATSVPRRRWGCASADIAAGRTADLIALAGSPFDDMEHLRKVRLVFRGQLLDLHARQSAASA